MTTAAQTQDAGPIAKKARRPREYETVYILEPAVDADEADRIATRLAEVVTRLGGKMTKVDNWGRRRLAYPIKRHTRAVYVCLKYLAFDDVVAELERNLRMLDSVIRFQSVQVRDFVPDFATVTIDPEEVKFRRVEVTEEEPEPSLEARLAMIDDPRRAPRAEGEGDEYGEGMGEDMSGMPEEMPAEEKKEA